MNNKRVWGLPCKQAARGGFTLIELLIVMVVVGILVTVALPKYKAALEKGRGLQGVANVAAYSEAVNVYYVKNGNSYGNDENIVKSFADVAGLTKDREDVPLFSQINAKLDNTHTKVTVSITRNSGSGYTITFENAGGEVTSRYCTGNLRYCKALGAGNCSNSTCYFN